MAETCGLVTYPTTPERSMMWVQQKLSMYLIVIICLLVTSCQPPTPSVESNIIGCPDSGSCLSASFSPDGKEAVVNVSFAHDYEPLSIVALETLAFRPLLVEARDQDYIAGQVMWPAWSPTGKHIAFYYEPKEEGQGIYVMDSNGENMHKLFDLPYGGGGLLNWSADESQLLYSRYDEVQRMWICIANLNGSDEKMLSMVDPLFEAAWSPDNSQIALIARYAGFENPDLYVIDLHDEQLVNLTNNGKLELEGSLTWSPDGERIAFTAYVPDQGDRLYIMNSDGTGKTMITEDGPYYDIYWSPDGTWLLGTQTSDGPNAHPVFFHETLVRIPLP